jgi:hypothetical protein
LCSKSAYSFLGFSSFFFLRISQFFIPSSL